MSQKSDLQALVSDLSAKIDASKASALLVSASVDALPEGDPDLQKKIDDLVAQVADLSGQLDSAKAALVSEDAALQADEAKISKLKEILLG